MGSTSSPIPDENKLKEIIESVNEFNKSSQNKNKIIINSANIIVNGQEINFQRSPPIEENNEPVFLTIIIKSEFGMFKLQVNSNEKVGDIIEKYKTKLQQDNIQNISFNTEKYPFLETNNQLKDYNLQNNSIINAKIEYKQNGNTNTQNKIFVNGNNLQKEKPISNKEIPSDELIKIRRTMKEKYKKGLITVVIKNSFGETRFFYVKPDTKFKIIEEEFKSCFPDKNWIFLFNGLVVDSEKTLNELNIKMLSVIVANELL
jgi:hypothetical protein